MRVVVKRSKLRPEVFRKLIIIAVFVSLVAGIIAIYFGMYRGDTPYEAIVNYQIKQDIDYEVEYNDSKVIDDPSTELTDTYIQSLIKGIKASLDYEYKMDQIGQITYDYKVVGTLIFDYLVSSDLENTEVRKKNYTFIDTVKVTQNDLSAVRLNDEVVIDYPKINQDVLDFREETKLPVSAYMDLVMTVNVTAITEDQTIKDTRVSSISIPFNSLAFSIKKNIAAPVEDTIKKYYEIDKFNLGSVVTGIVLICISVTLFGLNFKFIFKIRNRSKYEIDLERILKSNSDIIINLSTPIDDSDLNVVKVKTFNELLDLEDELRIPINFFELIPGQESEFTIIHNNVIYKYEYMNEDRI